LRSVISVYDAHEDVKLCEIGKTSADDRDENSADCSRWSGGDNEDILDFNITNMTTHPFLDELLLVYGSSGRIVLLNIRLGTVVWRPAKPETGLYRKVPFRTTTIDVCDFTPDGRQIV